MTDVFRADGAHPDARGLLADEAALPAGPFFVSLARFLAEREALLARGADLGVALSPEDRPEALAGDVGAIGAIAVAFPKFGDGRGYSIARVLRERLGFAGELRATGEVLWDQLEAMERCGFDTFVVTHAPTRARLERGERPAFAVRSQPTGATGGTVLAGRPWASTTRG